jgi:hypothetical protein
LVFGFYFFGACDFVFILWSLRFALPAGALLPSPQAMAVEERRQEIWNLLFGACDLRFGIYILIKRINPDRLESSSGLKITLIVLS